MAPRNGGRFLLAVAVGLISLNVFGDKENEMKISEQQLDGEKAIVMENSIYRATFVPARAMWPLWYFYKPTDHEVFVKKETAAGAYKSDDGMVLCMPWVGDSLKRVATKGLLKTAPWETHIEQQPGKAMAVGRKAIEYSDLTTSKTNCLLFTITASGQAQHSQIKLDYLIENIGRETAKFMLVSHARIAIGGSYDEGDYVYAPGPKCWVGDFKWPALDKQGVKPYQWTAWPIEGAVDFAPKPKSECKGEFVYAFVPSSWAVVGDNKSKEYTLFYCSPVSIGSQTQATPYYCILRRDGDYLLELGLTPELDAKYWERPEATASLKPGEKASFTLHITVGQNLGKDDVLRIKNVTHKSIELEDKSGPKTISLTP